MRASSRTSTCAAELGALGARAVNTGAGEGAPAAAVTGGRSTSGFSVVGVRCGALVSAELYPRPSRKGRGASDSLDFFEFFLVTRGKLLNVRSDLYKYYLELVYLFTKHFLKGKLCQTHFARPILWTSPCPFLKFAVN